MRTGNCIGIYAWQLVYNPPYNRKKIICYSATILPAKSDSDVMFCLRIYLGLRIDSGVYRLMFYLTIVNTTRRHCHSWLVGQYHVCLHFTYQLILFHDSPADKSSHRHIGLKYYTVVN